MSTLKILHGTYPNFEKQEFSAADILIKDGVIAKIEKAGTITTDTDETIDAEGLIVSPGFVNIHGHEDLIEDQYFSSRCELLDGVTTAAGGNCGDNYYPLNTFIRKITSCGSPTNYCSFVGQNYLRELVGADDLYKPSTPLQLEKMKKLLRQFCETASPLGLSCGFEYAPGITTEETIDLLKVLDHPNYLTAVHSRYDGARAVEATEELIHISKCSGIPIEMSHIGSCAASGYMEETLKKIEDARSQNIDITADCYPYHAFCTSIGSAVFDGDVFSQWKYSDIMLTDAPYKNLRCTKELFEKTRREYPEMYVVAFVMNEQEVEMAYKKPYTMVGSDGIYLHGAGHPRGAGSFARVLSHFTKDLRTLTLIEALYKMTLQPARRLHLAAKGDIQEGFDADLVIFDKDAVRDRATFENPTIPPAGIRYVILNGELAAKDNRIINDTLGTYVRPSFR